MRTFILGLLIFVGVISLVSSVFTLGFIGLDSAVMSLGFVGVMLSVDALRRETVGMAKLTQDLSIRLHGGK